MDTIVNREIKKTLQPMTHLSEKDLEAVYRMKNALINKLLHDPTLFLKSNGPQKNLSVYLDVTRKLFRLDE
jgi:glutamyl-tRNA reductase